VGEQSEVSVGCRVGRLSGQVIAHDVGTGELIDSDLSERGNDVPRERPLVLGGGLRFLVWYRVLSQVASGELGKSGESSSADACEGRIIAAGFFA